MNWMNKVWYFLFPYQKEEDRKWRVEMDRQECFLAKLNLALDQDEKDREQMIARFQQEQVDILSFLDK